MIKTEVDSYIGANGERIGSYLKDEITRLRNTRGLLISSNKYFEPGPKSGEPGFYFGPKRGQPAGSRVSWPGDGDSDSSAGGMHSNLTDGSRKFTGFDGSMEDSDAGTSSDFSVDKRLWQEPGSSSTGTGSTGASDKGAFFKEELGELLDNGKGRDWSALKEDVDEIVGRYADWVQEQSTIESQTKLSDVDSSDPSIASPFDDPLDSSSEIDLFADDPSTSTMPRWPGDHSSTDPSTSSDGSSTSDVTSDPSIASPFDNPGITPFDPTPGDSGPGDSGPGDIEMTEIAPKSPFDTGQPTSPFHDADGKFPRKVGPQPKVETDIDPHAVPSGEKVGADPVEMKYPGDDMALADRPSQTELSPEFTPEVRAGINKAIAAAKESGLSNEAIASEMGMGISSEGGLWITRTTLKGYLMKQAKGLMAMPIMAPLTMWMDTVQPGLGNALNTTLMVADFLNTGDPLGLLITGTVQLWQEAAKARQKVLDNDSPDKAYGSKFGYVREGDEWFPAIYNSRYQSTGLFAGQSSMLMDYGDDGIVWNLNGAGEWIPMIPNAKSKSFIMSDNEWDMTTRYGRGDKGAIVGSKDFLYGTMVGAGGAVKAGDITRDWYFMSNDEAKDFVSGKKHMTSYTADITKLNSSVRQVNDWRKALDFGQDWKWSSAIKTMGVGAAVNNYEGSRGMQRVLYEADSDGGMGYAHSKTADYDTYIRNVASGVGEDAVYSRHSTRDTFKDYLYKNVLQDHLQALYRTQKAAASEAGFKDLYRNDLNKTFDKAFDESMGDKAAGVASVKPGADVWSAMYLDTAKDMPVAATADILKQQLHDIELLNDRSPKQRNYLAQKVQTRYWIQQFVGMGESTGVMHYLLGRDWNNGDPYGNRKYTSTAGNQFEYFTGATKDYDTGNEGSSLHLDKLPGFAMPWQNAGENILPTLTGALAGTSAGDYMDDYRKSAYDRMSAEAIKNANAWIAATTGFNPNEVLEGRNVVGGLYTTPAAIAAKVRFAEGTRGGWTTPTTGVDLGWDPVARKYVPPGGQSPGLVLNPKTGEYELAHKESEGAEDLAKAGAITPPTKGPKVPVKGVDEGKFFAGAEHVATPIDAGSSRRFAVAPGWQYFEPNVDMVTGAPAWNDYGFYVAPDGRHVEASR